MVEIPSSLAAQRELGPRWAEWLDTLPKLADELLIEWGLSPVGAPMAGYTALVLPVLDESGTRRALKIAFPDEDNAGEIPTLQLWGGQHAVRLLRADPHRAALLLEWLDADLSAEPDVEIATAVVAGLYAGLHQPAAPRLRDIGPRVQRWLDDLEALGRQVPAPPHLIEQALLAGRRLAAEPGSHVLHGDLHYDNVMRRGDQWVAIDPKGHNGDPCFEVAPLLWNRWADLEATGNTGEAIRQRFYTAVDAAGLDERRARDWTLVRVIINVVWALQDAAGRPLDTGAQRSISQQVTIAKAMQGIEPAD